MFYGPNKRPQGSVTPEEKPKQCIQTTRRFPVTGKRLIAWHQAPGGLGTVIKTQEKFLEAWASP